MRECPLQADGLALSGWQRTSLCQGCEHGHEEGRVRCHSLLVFVFVFEVWVWVLDFYVVVLFVFFSVWMWVYLRLGVLCDRREEHFFGMSHINACVFDLMKDYVNSTICM